MSKSFTKTYPITKEGFAQMEQDIEARKLRKALVKALARVAVYSVIYVTVNVATMGVATVAFTPTSVADAGIKAFKILIKGV